MFHAVHISDGYLVNITPDCEPLEHNVHDRVRWPKLKKGIMFQVNKGCPLVPGKVYMCQREGKSYKGKVVFFATIIITRPIKRSRLIN